MKKIWKYIVAFFAFAGGVLVAFFSGKDSGRSQEKLKGIDKKLKTVKGLLKDKEKYKKSVQKELVNKKKDLEELKKQKDKKVKDVGADDAAEFLKKYANNKK